MNWKKMNYLFKWYISVKTVNIKENHNKQLYEVIVSAWMLLRIILDPFHVILFKIIYVKYFSGLAVNLSTFF